ncbi:MAG: rhomboid family intramembrane serine protease [Chitinophagales bacterium]|nr:rhomboid family intramembrane serine protease [Chitinophagales bacterium]
MRSNTIWTEIKQTFKRSDRMVYQLIALNVVVFLTVNIISIPYFLAGKSFNPESLRFYLGIPADFNQLLHQPWTLITYAFTHFEFTHILFNMLMLYWFGKILSEFLGNRKILPLYIMGGLFGALLFIITYQVFPVFSDAIAESRAWGASASVMAIMIAAATLVPDYTMFLLLFGSVKIKWIAVVLILLDIISIPTSNPGGHIAHLGGAFFGFVYIRQLQSGRDLGQGVNWLIDYFTHFFNKKPPVKIVHSSKKKTYSSAPQKKNVSVSKQEQLDTILDKIAQSGYDTLTKSEKDFLFNVSKEDK